MTTDTCPDHAPEHLSSHVEASDVLGDSPQSGTTLPLTALSLVAPFLFLDSAGCRCAAVRVGGRIVTGCFDHVHMHSRGHNGYVIVWRAVVAHAGSCTMLIRIYEFCEPRFIALHTLYIPSHFSDMHLSPSSIEQWSGANTTTWSVDIFSTLWVIKKPRVNRVSSPHRDHSLKFFTPVHKRDLVFADAMVSATLDVAGLLVYMNVG